MKKLIFVHGYGGEPIPFITELFKYLGYETIQQYIDYDYEWDLDECKSITEESIELSKDCDVVIGLSLGGYTANLIANKLRKKCILINPGIDRDRSQLEIKDFNYPLEKNDINLEVFLGARDFQIPNHYTTEYLKRNGIKARIEVLEDMYHVFNDEQFVRIVKMSNFFK